MNTQVGSDSRPIAARTRSNTSTGISGATASDFCNRRCIIKNRLIISTICVIAIVSRFFTKKHFCSVHKNHEST